MIMVKNKMKRADKKIAIVTGAAGFAGYSLTAHLIIHGYGVYAIVRPNSEHNDRLKPERLLSTIHDNANIYGGENLTADQIIRDLTVIELDSSEYDRIPELINEKCDVFFHLAWSGGRDDFYIQNENIKNSIDAVESAAKTSCSRFVCTGSQAEYGIKSEKIHESDLPEPINAYGSAKLAALYITKRRAEQLGIAWIWGRIFSLYGLYEPEGRMLPDLIRKLKNNESVNLSDCTQNWDYLDVRDAAEAIIALGESGHSGEIYNIAKGDYRPLKEYIELVEDRYSIPKGLVNYGKKADPFISLSPDVTKLLDHTGWRAKVGFLKNHRTID